MDNNKNKEENLVVLQYANNECYTQVVSVSDALTKHKDNFSVDIVKSTWRYGREEFQIGRSRDCDYNSRYGVIGVYNFSSIDQLDIMVHAANRAVERRGNCFDD